MEETIDIICQFSRGEINKIKSYWFKLHQLFSAFSERTSTSEPFLLEQSALDLDAEEDKRNEASLNQKHKTLIFSSQSKKNKIAISILIAIALLFFIGGTISKQILTYKQIEDLALLEETGYSVIKHFPITSVVGYAFGHCFFTNKFPDRQPLFNSSRFKDIMPILK